jgi:hypothetical protein
MLKRLFVLIASVALPLAAGAQSDVQLVQKYSAFTGSEENARTVVSGLREGADFDLGGTSFDPPTAEMGYGSVDTALALAQKNLAQQGVSAPTAEQLHAALIGTAEQPGVLQMRADGLGWGQIAKSFGYTVGDVKRSPTAQERLAARPEKPMRPEKFERPERPVKPERPERPMKPERPERPAR